jgi:DNA-binding transcriptional LysR family regulator
LLAAAKSGVGLAALPVAVGDPESELLRLLGPISEMTTHFYLVFHRDLRDSPRVRAFSAFVSDNMRTIRAVLGGGPHN